MTKDVKLSVRIAPAQAERLDMLARRAGLGKSAVLRLLVESAEIEPATLTFCAPKANSDGQILADSVAVAA